MSQSNGILRPVRRFTTHEVDLSTVLFLATTVALIVANNPLRELYHMSLAIPTGPSVLGPDIFQVYGEPMSFLVFTNDAPMVFFFLVVGLDIKQQLLVGELSSVEKAMMPVVGIIDGITMSIILFWLIAPTGDASRGVAIPMVTDIAFVLTALMLLKNHMPTSLRVFMTTLAVADDIGGIIVIALFHLTGISLPIFDLGLAVVTILILLGRVGVRHIGPYMIGLFVVWFFSLQSGIHTTTAGMMMVLTMPITTSVPRHQLGNLAGVISKMLPIEESAKKGQTTHLEGANITMINSLRHTAALAIPPVQHLKYVLTGWANYLILSVLAFASVGIDLSAFSMGGISTLSFMVMLGLLIGKLVGILLFTYVYILPTQHKWNDGVYSAVLFMVSILGGIGFTVSMFIASLSYDVHLHLGWLSETKLGILTDSLISGIVGCITVLAVSNRHQRRKAKQADWSG